jgi:hypothetical protein
MANKVTFERQSITYGAYALLTIWLLDTNEPRVKYINIFLQNTYQAYSRAWSTPVQNFQL